MNEPIAYAKFMTGTDALMHAFETDPHLRTSGIGLFLLEREPDPKVVRERFDRLSRLAPRFRQRIAEVPLSTSPPRYVVDPDFDLDYHVRFIGIPPGGTLRDLFDFLQVQQVQDLDKNRPQWEATVIGGLPDGKAALLFKSSHAVADGVGGLEMISPLFDTEPGADGLGPMPPAPEPERLSTAGLMREANDEGRALLGRIAGSAAHWMASLARHPVGTVQSSTDAVRSMWRVMGGGPPASTIMTERTLTVRCASITRPLDELRAAAKAAGGNLNDAFVAAVAGGLGRYHELHGSPVDELRMAMPVNIRGQAHTEHVAGNQFVVAKFPIPTAERDPARRIQIIRERSASVRGEPGLRLFTPMSDMLTRLPMPVLVPLFRRSLAAGIDVGTSNVPGPTSPMWIAGSRIESILLYGPIATVATNCTLISYCGDVHVAVQSNKAAIPDADAFLDCLADGFDEVLALTR